MNYKILIADDQNSVLDNFRDKLGVHLDIEPVFTSEASEVIRLVQKNPFDYAVLVLDYSFEGQELNGVDVAKEVLKINPKLLVLICTGDMTQEVPVACINAGVSGFIKKDEPFDEIIKKIRANCVKFDELSRVVTKTQNVNQKHLDNSVWIQKIGMVGWSTPMAHIAKKILTLSENGGDRSTVLIRGESGTGKELIAKAVKDHSSRKNKPFVSINCAAIPAELLESELFGHEKGAFTGADRKRLGKFQAATGGTIFLDEIGEMRTDLQAKLLRVLQEKVIEPVGSNKPVPVDVRVIAATHVDLEAKIESKEFREDLFYRLNHIPINVPALRERTEDISPLVTHFMEMHIAGRNKKMMYKTLQYLKAYEWSGNIRELENMIGRLLISTSEEEIKPQHLDPKVFDKSKANNLSYPQFKDLLAKEFEEREKEFLISKVRSFSSLRAASKALSIPNSSLQRKLSEWGYKLHAGAVS